MATLSQVEINAGAVTRPEAATGSVPAAAVPVIRVEDVHKSYDLGETKVHALRGVNLTIQPGEFVAIMGPAAAASPRS